MKRLLRGLIVVLIMLVSASVSFGAMLSLELSSVDIIPPQNQAIMNFYLKGASNPGNLVDSVAVALEPNEAYTLRAIAYPWNTPMRMQWLPAPSVPESGRFGATNFLPASFGGKPIGIDPGEDTFLFALLTFEVKENWLIPGKSYPVNFFLGLGLTELVSPEAEVYEFNTVPGSINIVPIPSAIVLLAGGLIGLMGLRRKFQR